MGDGDVPDGSERGTERGSPEAVPFLEVEIDQ